MRLSCYCADEEATESDRQTINFGIISDYSLITVMDEALKILGFSKKDCETVKFCEKLEGSFSAATTGGNINFIFYFFCLVKTEKSL